MDSASAARADEPRCDAHRLALHGQSERLPRPGRRGSPATAASSSLLTLLGVTALCLGLAAARRPPLPSLQGGCGPTSLQAVCRHFGVSATMDDIGRISGGDSPISSLAELQSGARALGLKAEGLEMSIAQLRRTRPLG